MLQTPQNSRTRQPHHHMEYCHIQDTRLSGLTPFQTQSGYSIVPPTTPTGLSLDSLVCNNPRLKIEKIKTSAEKIYRMFYSLHLYLVLWFYSRQIFLEKINVTQSFSLIFLHLTLCSSKLSLSNMKKASEKKSRWIANGHKNKNEKILKQKRKKNGKRFFKT